MAYCLLGLFDVNMALLYGEGSKAFKRLQYEIIRFSNDESIFAWTNPSPRLKYSGMFAGSPADFFRSGDICPMDFTGLGERSFSMTNLGLTIKLQCEAPMDSDINTTDTTESMNYWTAPLACGRGPSDLQRAPVILTPERKEGNIFRVNLLRLELFSKMTRPPSLQFFTQTLHVSDGRKASLLNLNDVLVYPSKGYPSSVCFNLSTQVRNGFQVTHMPSGFYEDPIANRGTRFLSQRTSAASVASLELHRHDNQYLRLNFHGARNSTTRLEVSWTKKETSVYNNWLDYLDEPSDIIYPNQRVTHSLEEDWSEGDSMLTVSLAGSPGTEHSIERFWKIYIFSHGNSSGIDHTGIGGFSNGLSRAVNGYSRAAKPKDST